MTSDGKNSEKSNVPVELKYCEHCGGLWVRERGAGVVYCDKCQPKVADLPIPKKKPSRLRLPVGPHPQVKTFEGDVTEESSDLGAVGGVA